MGENYKVTGSTILQILTVMLGFYSIGANVNLTVIDGFFDKHVFECNKPVTFRCSVPPNSAIVQWFVGNTTATKLDVNCGGILCGNSSNFPERYTYTFDESTGISGLKITNATFQDDHLTYQCSDGSESASYNTTTILAPPKNDTIDVNIDFTTPEKVTANLTTNCIYPFQDLVVVWFSTQVDVNETQIYSVSHKQVPCSPSSACSRANTSLESVLPINITKTGQERVFYVNISFGSMHISRIVGKYNVTEGFNEVDCDKNKGIPCWAFGVILEVIIFIASIVVFGVHVSGVFANNKTRMYILKASSVSVVIIAHIVVTLISRFCKAENSCVNIICVPCWVYWLIQNGIIVATIACVILVNVLCDKFKTGFCYWKLYAIFGIATHIAIILVAEYCKMRDTSIEKRCLPCWGYGVILVGILIVAAFCTLLIKVCYPSGRIGCLWYWEMFVLAVFFMVIIYLVVIIIVSGAYKQCDRIEEKSFGCWAIYLIIFGVIVMCFPCCLFLYVFIEPMRSVKIISRKVEEKGMSIKFQWESRLAELKTYYIQLECKGKMLEPLELDHNLRQGGLLEYELTGLKLDTDYEAHLYSLVCKLPSLNKQLAFDTKGRAMPPTNIYQDEQLRTEDSVTLRWSAAKGPKQYVIVKYKRSKRPKSDWLISDKISKNWYTIDGLRPGTSYTIIVYAENNVARSLESEPLFVKTRALKPVPPQDFKCTHYTENEVHLSWKPSKKIKNQQFLLTVFNNSEKINPGLAKYEQETCIKYNGEKTMTHTVSKLSPGCNYVFEIFTSAGNALSESSKVVTVDTKGIRKELLIDRKQQATATTVFHVKHEK